MCIPIGPVAVTVCYDKRDRHNIIKEEAQIWSQEEGDVNNLMWYSTRSACEERGDQKIKRD